MCGKFSFSPMIFAEVIANKSFSKGKPFKTRACLLATSSPGRFSLALQVAPSGRGCSIFFTKKTFTNKQGRQTNYSSLPSINGNF